MSNFDNRVDGHHLEASVVTHPRVGVMVRIDGHTRFIEAGESCGPPVVHHYGPELRAAVLSYKGT